MKYRFLIQLSVRGEIKNAHCRSETAWRALAAAFAHEYAGDETAVFRVWNLHKSADCIYRWPEPKPVSSPEHPMVALFAKAIENGHPVTIIEGGQAARFNQGARP